MNEAKVKLESKNNELYRLNIKSYLMTLFWCTLYKLILEYTYIFFVSPRWGYAGFFYSSPGFGSYFISWILLIMLSLPCCQLGKIKTFSSTIMQCLIYLSFFPGIVLYTFREQPIFLLYCLYWFLLILYYFLINTQKFKPVQFNINEKILSYLSIASFLFCFYVWASYAHFHIQIDIINIYGLREEAAYFDMLTLTKYAYGTVQVCIPFLAVWSLDKKKRCIFVILCCAQVLAFFSQGSKSAFFALIVALVAHYFIEMENKKNSDSNLSNGKHAVSIILRGLTIASVFSFAEFHLLESHYLIDYMFRRNMFLPNLLNIYYYDFFSINEFDYFRGSIIRVFGFESPYSTIQVPYIIGGTYFNAPNMYSNNGLFSDAYMNIGVAGIVIMPLMIILLLKLFDRCIGKVKLSIQIGAAIYVVFCLMGSSFFTNLFTHGFLALAFLFCILPKEDAIRFKIGK